MSTTLDANTSPTDPRHPHDQRIQSPPAFLDLADSVCIFYRPSYVSLTPNCLLAFQAARLGGNISDVTAVGVSGRATHGEYVVN